jgi:hypothetical protein
MSNDEIKKKIKSNVEEKNSSKLELTWLPCYLRYKIEIKKKLEKRLKLNKRTLEKKSELTWLIHYPRYKIKITLQKKNRTNNEAQGPTIKYEKMNFKTKINF